MGGGSGLSGLHGQPDGVVVVVGSGGFVAAGGGVGGADVWVCVALVVRADVGVLDEVELLDGTLDDVGVLVLGVLLTQLDAGVRLSGSSSGPPITTPTSTPSSAEPSTAEPDAAQSARTAILLTGPGRKGVRSRSQGPYR
ncbi:hypothetical protein FKR81_37095 [Lentzea tibetensis]|uniref:Uncharacterized protein n=1 Tax=Lentzea tibetensis TaxID=2591470 RepID=A0A563EI67_9PSEU|nr:hypothetical protein [Lentzea tibetensis]TWP46147.1 hypothetical protein FKR81_37095 [Lentzea tibetensis]